MAELLLELLSEEIPARLQSWAAGYLATSLTQCLGALQPTDVQSYSGPRRIAVTATLQSRSDDVRVVERGPRLSAPDQALSGFLRKHSVSRDMLIEEGDHWALHKCLPGLEASNLVTAAFPVMLRQFKWPKSMRWGATGSSFAWTRPLRRILCLLEGQAVPFSLAEAADDGHGLVAANETEGHRFMAPGVFAVRSVSEWQRRLLDKFVVVQANDRRRQIEQGLATLATERGLHIVADPALLDEVAGLVEWPVPLLGRIDPVFMDLPNEVMRVSMRVNQRYFALQAHDGSAAPFFAFAANVAAADGGAAIVAGNERVLRARFADAKYFWDTDRRVTLASRVPQLDSVTFHAKLGTQGARVHRLMQLAEAIAPGVGADPILAARAAWLSKADLVSGMVAEFPELQGVMGRYYALNDGENPAVADAIADHYGPKGPSDTIPTAPVTLALALADKIDLLSCFFAIGEGPTGSSDPFALRRAAIGIVRILRATGHHLRLRPLIALCATSLRAAPPVEAVLQFIVERARILIRTDGARHDILDAVFAANSSDDLASLLKLSTELGQLLETPAGTDLLVAYKRAANILRIETAKDGPHSEPPDSALFNTDAEVGLDDTVDHVASALVADLQTDNFAGAIRELSRIREPLDMFFAVVTVNDSSLPLRLNRLRLLHRVCQTMNRVADFSRIEG